MLDITIRQWHAALAALANTATDEEVKNARPEGYEFGWRCYENSWPMLVITEGEHRGFHDAEAHYAAWARQAQAVAQ